MKRNSLFFLYFLAIALALLLFRPTHLSTNMLAIFKNDANIEKLKTVNSFEQASTLFVSLKGFSKENRNRLLAIEKRLQKLPYIKSTNFNTSKIEIPEYMKKNYYLLSEFKGGDFNETTVKEKLKELRESLLTSTFYSPIDRNDPLKLFKFNLPSDNSLTKDGFLVLGEYGYLITAQLSVKAGDMKEAREVEKSLHGTFKREEGLFLFSTLFFMAQNSTVIEQSVHTILYLSFGLLILLFFITLRDYKLLLLNSITLASSVLFALGISTYFFTEVSIFVLAFGSAISSMAVDYLFHNYFHRQYLKREINLSIMWAFLTTILGFVMLQFVAFPLIAQLAVFAILSLSFSYFQFTFLYPYFKLVPKEKRVNLSVISKTKKFLPSNMLFIVSIVMIVYASWNVEFDYNLRNLDYDNKPLKEQQHIIENAIQKRATVLIEANSLDELIVKASELKSKVPSIHSLADVALSQNSFTQKEKGFESYNFEKLKSLINHISKEVGFKEGYFKNAYNFIDSIPKVYNPKIETFKQLGFEVIEKDNKFYTLANIDKKASSKINEEEGITLVNGSELIKSTMNTMFKSLLTYLALSFISIIVLIRVIVKKRTILALNFILFPIAMILLYLSFTQINIMHLFSIIIIIVAGIDYGIYMSQESSRETEEAIFYSLFTSFSGFGILILSQIGAIHAIGEVITIGIISILFLVLFLKKQY